MAKRAEKSLAKSRALHGVAAHPEMRGRGPAPGTGGRPPDAWKAKMRELRDKWLIAADAGGVLSDPTHPQWMSAAKFVHEATEGKPAQAVDITTGGERIFVAEVPPKAESEDAWKRSHKPK